MPDAILRCREAGIKVHMVTGDALSVAGSFGAKCGILAPTEDWPTAEWSYFGCNSKAFHRHLVDPTDKVRTLPSLARFVSFRLRFWFF